jgi:hypothetical protein
MSNTENSQEASSSKFKQVQVLPDAPWAKLAASARTRWRRKGLGKMWDARWLVYRGCE